MSSLEKLDEPAVKKAKITEEDVSMSEHIDELRSKVARSTSNLRPIISDEFSKSIPPCRVYVATIKDPKDISKTIRALNEKLPLKELQHLKRVRKREIILCLQDSLAVPIEVYLEKNILDSLEVLGEFKEIEVPAIAPKLKWQFTETNKLWPCNFHPNSYNEKLISENFFDCRELALHKTYMGVAFEVLKLHPQLVDAQLVGGHFGLDRCGAAIVVDPKIQSIVAVALDKRDDNPLKHATMLAIDSVARTQNGGAWSSQEKFTKETELIMNGIDNVILVHLKKEYPQLKYGARKFKSKRSMTDDVAAERDDCGPYLCTGYDVYTINEPCVMCAMALVHARAKRVFFCFDNESCGALKTKVKLQTVSSLNHHFEVFSGFL